jgi:hypothetical protein
MIECFFEAKHRVLMVRARGVYDVEAMHAFDDLVRRFVARNGPVRSIYDFSEIEQITVPMTRLADRAKEPSIAGGLRVLIAPAVIGAGLTRSYSEWQSNAGQTALMVVGRMEEAYVMLGLDYKVKFEPVTIE